MQLIQILKEIKLIKNKNKLKVETFTMGFYKVLGISFIDGKFGIGFQDHFNEKYNIKEKDFVIWIDYDKRYQIDLVKVFLNNLQIPYRQEDQTHFIIPSSFVEIVK